MTETLTIETGRLLLRPMSRRDMDSIVAVSSDPIVWQHLNAGWPMARCDVEAWVAESGRRLRRTGFGSRAIVLKATGEVIGWIGLSKRAYQGGLELTIALAPEHRGKGLGTEAVNDVLPVDGASLSYAWVHPSHTPSLRILEGCGFEFDDEQPEEWRAPAIKMVRIVPDHDADIGF